MVVTIIFYVCLALGAMFTFVGVTVGPRIFWLAGLTMYVASYVAPGTSGQYWMAAPYMLFALAIAGLFRQLKKPIAYAIVCGIGLVLWLIGYFAVDMESYFRPFGWVYDNAYDLLRGIMKQGA